MSTAQKYAPDPHTHGHDVGALSDWMSDVTESTLEGMARGKRAAGVRGGPQDAAEVLEPGSRAADVLSEELYAKGKMYTVFHNELARQTAVHCPRVARCVLSVGNVCDAARSPDGAAEGFCCNVCYYPCLICACVGCAGALCV